MSIAMKPLLILDLDETLIRGATESLEREPDMVLAHYFVYFRPHAQDFLRRVQDDFTLALWSSATSAYIRPIARAVWGDLPQPLFVWDRSHCTVRYDFHQRHEFYIKDLRKAAINGYDLNRILMVDDELRKVSYQHANAIRIDQFLGDESDEELLHLARYLQSIKGAPDFRRIDKSLWRPT